MLGNYTKVPDIDDCIMTIVEFDNDCNFGAFIDYDGYGYPMKKGLVDRSIKVWPSDRKTSVPEDATHIVWYNR